MVTQTPNHGLNKYHEGEADWTHAPDMQAIEERLIIRDTQDNLQNYRPYPTTSFIATDTGAVFDGGGELWEPSDRGFGRVAANTIEAKTLKVTDEIELPDGAGLGPTRAANAAAAGAGGHLVEGNTVADIDAALDTHNVVRLVPGTVYRNNGSTIRFNGDINQVVKAHGAAVEVRSNPTVFMPEASIRGGWSRWLGGSMVGSQSAGEIAFQVEDAIFCDIFPQYISDCQVAVALTNDDLWCEFTRVRYYGIDNEIGTILLGGDGTPPSGVSINRTNGGADDSPSFRFLQLEAYDQLRGHEDRDVPTGYGIYMDHASPYTGTMNYTVSMGPRTVGWRYHHRMNGNNIYYHAESPKGHDEGGIGFQVDRNKRWSAMARMRIGGGVETTVQNNTNDPILYYDTTLGDETYGWRLMRDGDPMITFAKEGSDHVMRMPGIDRIRLGNGRTIG